MFRFKSQLLLVVLTLLTSGCSYLRIDMDHVLLRSDVITSLEKEKEVLSKAHLEWTADRRVRVLYVSGTPYERGYQQGALLRNEVRTNLQTLYDNALSKFHSKEFFAETYERLRPYIPQEYIDEMRGLAHGSRMPLEVIHYIHALPEITEWGGKKKLKAIVNQMRDGDFINGTTCSNFCVSGDASADGRMYTVRILDWGLHRISKLHEYPLIMVVNPDKGTPSAVITWVGFLGAVSGMNAQSITLGEMGYGDPDYETLSGTPMPFMLRDVLTHTDTLAEAREHIKDYPGTSSFVFLISDGKTKTSEIFIKDSKRFLKFDPGQPLEDSEKTFPSIPDTLYGGHYDEKMTQLLKENHGKIEPQMIMNDLIPQMAMKSNFQNVVYDPERLRFWVSNAANSQEWAASQKYTFFDLKEALKKFK